MLANAEAGEHWGPLRGRLSDGVRLGDAIGHHVLEQAGVVGEVADEPIGLYDEVQTTANGVMKTVPVRLYPVLVRSQTEPASRPRRAALWFEPADAVSVVKEPDLARLLAQFQPELVI